MTANASRLRARIESVRCEVVVVRDDFQAEAFDKMKQKMAELVSAIETESEGATEKLQLYINCCSREEGQVLILMTLSESAYLYLIIAITQTSSRPITHR